MAPRRVVVTAFDGVELLDLTGPLEVLSAATRALAGRPGGYRTAVAGPRSGPVECAGGTRLVAEVAWDEVRLPIDTLIVAGALSVEHGRATAVVDERLVQWVRSTAPRCRRVVSVCAGAHVLAEAGLLDGRRAATHWATAHELARRSDRIVVDPDAIFVRDGFVWTSAGVSSGLDLTLALVAEDHGAALARQLRHPSPRSPTRHMATLPTSRRHGSSPTVTGPTSSVGVCCTRSAATWTRRCCTSARCCTTSRSGPASTTA